MFKYQRHPLNNMKINLEAFNLELLQKSLLSEEEKKVLLRLWNDEYPIIIRMFKLEVQFVKSVNFIFA